jgi:hypothetical protein
MGQLQTLLQRSLYLDLFPIRGKALTSEASRASPRSKRARLNEVFATRLDAGHALQHVRGVPRSWSGTPADRSVN